MTLPARILGPFLAGVVGGTIAAVLANGATAAALPGPVPRVCCRALLPPKGDTIRLAVICADVFPRDSLGGARVSGTGAREQDQGKRR